jgi:hypothetical protein
VRAEFGEIPYAAFQAATCRERSVGQEADDTAELALGSAGREARLTE